MAKKKKQGWQLGEGPYSKSSDLKFTQYRGNLGESDNFRDSTDRAATVDQNEAIDGGYSSKLVSSKR